MLLKTIITILTFIKLINNEISDYKIDKTELREVLSDDINLYFVAFYDKEDIKNPRNEEFLENVKKVSEIFKEKISFYWYEDEIPLDITSKYYLYYYTLPKLKFFDKAKHETYNSGKSVSHISNWVKRKLRTVKNHSVFIGTLKSFETELFALENILIFIGDLKSKKFENYKLSIEGLFYHGFFHTNSTEIKNELSLINFEANPFSIIHLIKGPGKKYQYNHFSLTKITPQKIKEYIKSPIKKKIHTLTEELFTNVYKNKEVILIYFGNPSKFKIYQKFCNSQKSLNCTKILKNIAENSNKFWIYFAQHPEDIAIYIIDSIHLHEKPLRFRLSNFETSEDIRDFYKSYLSKGLKYLQNSEKLESYRESGKRIWNVVGNGFYEFLESRECDWLVIFYGSNCKRCEEFFERVEEVDKYLKRKYSNFEFLFGRVDVVKNDPPFHVKLNPDFYIFPKGNVREPIKVSLPDNYEFLLQFVLKNAPILKDIELKEI